MRKILYFYFILLLVLTGCETSSSHTTVRSYSRPATPHYSEFIKATGIGHPPPNATSPAQADLLARENAKTLAFRELNRKIQTIPVQGGQTVEQRIFRNPQLKAKVEDTVQKAKIISERKEKDNSWVIEISIRYSDLKTACQ